MQPLFDIQFFHVCEGLLGSNPLFFEKKDWDISCVYFFGDLVFGFYGESLYLPRKIKLYA